MDKIDSAGSFYLGKSAGKPFFYDSKNLTTHAVCLGMTGSGKTGLAIALIEEAALQGIPSILIDPKGDLGNLMLTFPKLDAESFLPWVDQAEAERKNEPVDKYAAFMAKTWKEGLAKWGEDEERIKKLREKVDISIYTPASAAGTPLSILSSFEAPSDELLLDATALRDRIMSTTSSLLGLLGINADPIKSREHILISTIIEKQWRAKKDLDLPLLIEQIQDPPFHKVGVFDVDTFFPEKERLNLSLSLNHLLASPGFSAWMEGEPLNIQNLYYTKSGKPRISILSIAHLSDSERMFFVTLFLNQLLSWMRRQSGTSNLSALFYMDEIFGYFPPIATPPSKQPMLSLLKQARAFGLGIVLSTQNPVDLDYKGLANCGTWFIGKLQTERDKSRVVEGLSAASNGEINISKMNELIAKTGSRIFILRSIYLKEPILFETRWTMSYLRGPLTLTQIQKLMGNAEKPLLIKEVDAKAPRSPLQELFLNRESLSRYAARALGVGKLHFVDSKNKIDTWVPIALAALPEENGVNWDKSEDVTTFLNQFEKSAPENAAFQELPKLLTQNKSIPSLTKSFADYLYQEKTYDLFISKDKKLIGAPGETEEAFRKRLALEGSQNSTNLQRIEAKYNSKLQILQDKIRRQQEKAATQQAQVSQQKMNTWISFGTTLLGSLLGKKISKGTITDTGTALKRAGRIGKEQEEAARAEESLTLLQQQLEALQAEKNQEINQALLQNDVEFDKITLRPRKSDIAVESISILWVPTNP